MNWDQGLGYLPELSQVLEGGAEALAWDSGPQEQARNHLVHSMLPPPQKEETLLG